MIDVDVAFIQRRDEAVLLQLRRPDRDFPLTWECPGGKRRGDGETVASCVLRELEEELGIHPRDATVREDFIFAEVFTEFGCRVNFHRVELRPSLYLTSVVLRDALAVGWFLPHAVPHVLLAPGNRAFFRHLGWLK